MLQSITRSVAVCAAAVAVCVVSGCGSQAHHSDRAAAPDPGRAPAEVRWETWQGVALPIGAKDGPAQVGATVSGFSHTPQGAALAAIQLPVRMALAPDDAWTTVAARSLVSNAGKDEWVRDRVLVSIPRTDPSVAPRISGYKITSFSPDTANVTVFSTYPDASRLASDTTVDWVAGDWRLALPDPATKVVREHNIPDFPADMVRLEAQR